MQRQFWTTSALRASGRSQREVRRAVERSLLIEVRRGLFAVPGADPQLIRAARVGGIATGTTASRVRTLWTPPDPRLTAPPDPAALTPPDPRLQVAVPRNAANLRDPDDPDLPLFPSESVLVHWVDPARLQAGRAAGLAPVLLMLEHVFRSQPPERALAVLESALRHRFLGRADVYALAAKVPENLRGVVLSAMEKADSGIETIVRFHLERLGIDVRVLVSLSAIGTVDLLIDGWLIVELDGREFHTGAQFERDRVRDAQAAIDRRRTLRFSWRMVMFDWDTVEAAIMTALTLRAVG